MDQWFDPSLFCHENWLILGKGNWEELPAIEKVSLGEPAVDPDQMSIEETPADAEA